MSLDTIMSTAASYMEDFALYEFAGAVEDYQNRPKGMIKAALERAIAYGETLNARQGPIDEVDDLIRACKEAYDAYMGSMNESKLDKIVSESVKRVLSEALNHYGQAIINLDGNPSLVTIMEYIRDNGGPTIGKWQFTFNNGKMLICSPLSQDDDMLEIALDELPLEEWHDVLGMKRIKFYSGWIIYVNKRFYFLG